jgi:hypothetical protein
MNNVELAAHQSERPARPRLPTTPHVPGTERSRRGRTTVSSPDNAFAYVNSRSLRELLQRRAIRHVRTRPYTPRTNGKVERYQQTLQREWAYALEYASSKARRASLPHWLRHYNERRTHSALGNRTPLTRVREVTGLNT